MNYTVLGAGGAEYGMKNLALKYGASAALIFVNANILIYAFVFIVYGVVGALPDSSELLDTASDSGYLLIMALNEFASYLVPMIAFPLIFRGELTDRRRIPAFAENSGYKRIFGSAAILFLAGITCAMSMSTVTSYISEILNTLLGVPETRTAFSETMPTNVFKYAVFEICTCIIAPVCEELIYRHYLLKPLRIYGDITAAVVPSLLFGLSHFNFDQFLYTFTFGLFLSIIAIRTGSVLPSIICHILNNVMVGLNVYMPETFGSDAVDAFFGAAADVCALATGLSYIAGWIALILVVVLRLYKLRGSTGELPAKRQFFLIFTNPLMIVSIVLMLAVTFMKLYK